MSNNYTYQIFEADDHSNARVDTARKSFGYEDTACYVISNNGQMCAIQSEMDLPHPGATIQASADNHIAALVEANAVGE